MSRSLLFYVLSEFTDSTKYCKKKGLTPYRIKEMSTGVEGDPVIQMPIQYVKNGYIYDVLEGNPYDCGMTILMRLPKSSYEELLDVALNSKYDEERMGAVSIMLKDHPKEFKQFLVSMMDVDVETMKNKKNFKKMVTHVYHMIDGSSLVRQMEDIRDICYELGASVKEMVW